MGDAHSRLNHSAGGLMPEYRFYSLTSSDRIAGPARIADCDGDKDAIAEARDLFPDQAFEVWEGSRKIFSKNRVFEDSHERCIVSRESSSLNRMLVEDSRSAIKESKELLRRTKSD